jgi:hypothetical protein
LRDAVYRCAGGRLVQAPEDWHVRGAKPSGVTESAGPIPDFARRHRSTCQYRSDNRKLTRGQGGRVQCFDAQFY